MQTVDEKLKQVIDDVYHTLIGLYLPEFCVPWVENIMDGENAYVEDFQAVYVSYEKLLTRLGKEDEDADIIDILNAEDAKQAIIAREMFLYGMKFQRKLQR